AAVRSSTRQSSARSTDRTRRSVDGNTHAVRIARAPYRFDDLHSPQRIGGGTQSWRAIRDAIEPCAVMHGTERFRGERRAMPLGSKRLRRVYRKRPTLAAQPNRPAVAVQLEPEPVTALDLD